MKDRIRSGQYSLEGDCWVNVSEDAKDLIKKMLETNPVQRISINDIMDSKWLKVMRANQQSVKKTKLKQSFPPL